MEEIQTIEDAFIEANAIYRIGQKVKLLNLQGTHKITSEIKMGKNLIYFIDEEDSIIKVLFDLNSGEWAEIVGVPADQKFERQLFRIKRDYPIDTIFQSFDSDEIFKTVQSGEITANDEYIYLDDAPVYDIINDEYAKKIDLDDENEDEFISIIKSRIKNIEHQMYNTEPERHKYLAGEVSGLRKALLIYILDI